MTARGVIVRGAGALLALVLVAGVVAAQPSPPPDAGVADGGAAGGDAGPPRIVIDGPTLLGIGKPQVSASASPTEMRLGDKFTLFVEVLFDENVTVSIPAGLDLAPAFDELKRSSVDERRSDGTRKRVYQIQLQAWELGDVRLPPVQVAYTVGGDSSWVVTNEVPLRIVGSIDAIDDPNALLGATPPVPLHRRDWRVIAAIIVGVAAVVGLIVWLLVRRYLRNRRRRVAPRQDEPMLDSLASLPTEVPGESVAAAVPTTRAVVKAPVMRAAWIDLRVVGDAARRALEALDRLEQSDALRTDQLVGYRTMVGAVRTFLLEQFALPSRHRTSRELVTALGKTSIGADERAGVDAWLASADLVKFANAVDPADGADALARARQLIVAIDRGAQGRTTS